MREIETVNKESRDSLTKWHFCDNRVGRLQIFAGAIFIDRSHTEVVFLVFPQSLYITRQILKKENFD